MAMTISVPAPASPSASGTPTSADSPHSHSPAGPQTLALPPPVDGSPATNTNNAAVNDAPANPAAPAKRKPSRRANTAERRATHNAVERQRRETLNGRFLDLAALLPNLSQIRRPSKSSIVNSSIAHIHASRRHRLLAARELRLLKLETDALRRELNEWRDRSGLPRVEEPVRGDGFHMILSGEVEVINAGPIEEEDGSGDYGDNDYGDDDYQGAMVGASAHDDDLRGLIKTNTADVTPFAHNVPPPSVQTANHLHLQSIMPRPHSHGAPSPMGVPSPTNVSFENPALPVGSMYEQPHSMHNSGQFYHGSHVDKVNAWHNHVYGAAPAHQQSQQQFTPPGSSHSGNSSPPMQQAAYLMNLRQQHMMQSSAATLQTHHGHMYGSPIDGDDTSSVGSAAGAGMGGGMGDVRRERSGSMGSAGATHGMAGVPGRSSSASSGSSYELPNVGIVGVPRRMNSGMGGVGVWEEGMGMNGMGSMGMAGGMGPGMGGMGMGGMMKTPQAISVGGGGNAHGFAAMMM